ncbi:unnamed protein product [Prorocentrum cordatum]|uniref:Uncharacterized protein n=1 Tax=Prorocentrum cordatum TaxID=2364126 RepID=A0ABN9UK65_9DINO|nr:unnamed protein product [Polarella glacialis]
MRKRITVTGAYLEKQLADSEAAPREEAAPVVQRRATEPFAPGSREHGEMPVAMGDLVHAFVALAESGWVYGYKLDDEETRCATGAGCQPRCWSRWTTSSPWRRRGWRAARPRRPASGPEAKGRRQRARGRRGRAAGHRRSARGLGRLAAAAPAASAQRRGPRAGARSSCRPRRGESPRSGRR